MAPDTRFPDRIKGRGALRALIEQRRISRAYGRRRVVTVLAGGSQGDVAISAMIDADHQIEDRRAE
ncbi:hypothetical protein [Rubrimonas cliftonensis]|uniref:Uncharacterized protein n=1 Tax=Rubrimonas cliftonensis TaxID=89524 RepID=A0A1H3VRV1_9RHOB|nr:hypothetical protein [Rubrimonas cliftonensis]SDZ76974.1 hypothetical protein SAMN05444370_101259 [Rubrimonas cliftonensis]